MKKIATLIALCSLTFAGMAQETKSGSGDADSTKKDRSVTIKIGRNNDSNRDTIETASKGRFSLGITFDEIDIGLSRLTDNGSFTLTPANSYLEYESWKTSNFAFEFLQMGYRFNSNFKIYLSAGLDWNHIRLKENITFQKNQPTLTYVTETIDFKKNRFSSRYLRVPLNFQVRSNDDKRGKKVVFTFGPELGFLLNGKVKQVSEENGKDKFKDDYNFEPLRYGAFAKLGYGGVGIFTKYYFNDVFAEGQGPKDLKQMSFGLTFGL